MGYCLGVKSEDITLANAEKTAQEFEHYLSDPHCLGIKFYPGYRPVFIYDERHYPLCLWQCIQAIQQRLLLNCVMPTR